MSEPLSPERDREGIVSCRARVADTRAHVALLDEVVSRLDPSPRYALSVHQARALLDQALGKLDAANSEVASVLSADHTAD